MQSLTLKIKGLYTHASELSSVPDGALSVADNIVIDRESVASPRRGFDRATYGYTTSSYRANKLFFYQDKILSHFSTNLLAWYNTASGWTTLGSTYSPPTSTVPVRAVQANQNFYYTTAAGVYKLDAYNGTPVVSGAYKALGVTAATSASASTWLTNAYSTAYRVVWGYKDANNNLILGAPSQREELTNSSGSSKAIDLTISIPAGVTTSWFYQVYRAAAVSTGNPSDEMGLVYEANPAAGDITNKYVTITDITPDVLRGATLYTSASQEGLAAGNERAPLCKDIAVYKNYAFYGNTTSKHRYYLTLLSVSGVGIAANDTVTIAGVVYTGKAAETAASGEFKVTTSGSASQNIRDTAISLVRVINTYASNTLVYAYYLSSSDDLPGKILIEERGLGSSSFACISSKATCWSPALPTSGVTQSSTNDRYKHAIYFSKESQPEAVPLTNFFFCGSADKEILRIIPLRDSLFILKEDGIYKLSGSDAGSFRVDLFDSTTHLLGAETAVVLNNQIMALTDQGVVAISESGVQVKSRPIEYTLLSLQGVSLSNLKNYSFAVAYESERKYILFVPKVAGDTTATQAYVYNTFTDSWVRWNLANTCGGVNPADDKMCLGDATSEFLLQERKNYNYTDYVDYGLTTTISAVSSTLITLSSSDLISVGDIVYQSASIFATVTAVDTSAGTVTVDVDPTFTVAAATVYKAITSAVAWVPFTGGNPGVQKQFREATLLFKQDFTGTATLTFFSDVSPYEEDETLTGSSQGAWGLFIWGAVPWGGEHIRRPFRVYVPQNKQRASQLTVKFEHSIGYADYQLNGISLIANNMSERVGNNG